MLARQRVYLMKIRTFTVVVETDPDSGWLVGEVPELPGCFTEAPDLPTLHRNIWEAIVGYLKVAEPEAPVPTEFYEHWQLKAIA
jgi:predicted RNase H-like HicB family nuclease